MNQRQQLASEILEFLNKHGKRAVNEGDGKWNSPDGSEMECVAELLMNEKVKLSEIDIPHSNWESGGYQPYADAKAKQWHNSLKQRAIELIKS